ncbi:GNAT family N-acetyltransferase [Streptomyces heilongjiangensis]|nr:GNAT family N-acetyltransferase [Streptomyces heilongjiangensis]MDC2947914.1 GNAT family N-acetyltransferase [Streptomyces heilongjiangensis]
MTYKDGERPVIETSRLTLRRWTEDDVVPLSRVNGDPAVMRWIGDGSVRDEEQTRAGIRAMEERWEATGSGIFALQERATGRLIGLAGLWTPDFLPELLPCVEAVWRLGRSSWGRGFGTEAAEAVMRFGFQQCGLDRIVGIVQKGNDASENIMKKLGMRRERDTTDPATGRALRVYELTRAECRPVD